LRCEFKEHEISAEIPNEIKKKVHFRLDFFWLYSEVTWYADAKVWLRDLFTQNGMLFSFNVKMNCT